MKKWQHFSFPQNVKKSIFGIKIAKNCFPLFSKNAIPLARRGEARRRRRRRRGGGGGEAEAEARRGDGGARAGGRAGGRRRPRTAVVYDAFLRPHAKFQVVIINRVFECLIDELLAI